MNTPAHLVLNLALLGGGARVAHTRAIAAGALLPDLPMFGFYLWQKLVRAAPERVIWGERYFDADWQVFFDVFNSIPLAAAGLGIALVFRRIGPALFCGSVIAHALLDLPLHREDAHGHFWPFSDWRFVSPVSYWDSAHFGATASFAETALLCAAAVVLWRRHPQRSVRAPLALLAALSVAVWTLFYGLGVIGPQP